MAEKAAAATKVDESVDSEDEPLAIDENPQEPLNDESVDQTDVTNDTDGIDTPAAHEQTDGTLKQIDEVQTSRSNEECTEDLDNDNSSPISNDGSQYSIEEAQAPMDQGPEPMDEGPEPADEGPKPADEGPKPADEGPEPADEGPEPADEGPEPADERPEPADDGPEPAYDGPEPADEGPEQTDASPASSMQEEVEDLEDGELSDEPDQTDAAPNTESNTTQESTEVSEQNTELLTEENKGIETSSPERRGRKRSHSDSSKDDSKEAAAVKEYSSDSSTSSEEDRSERKRRKKEKRRRKKEKKRKDKEKDKARKKRRRQRSDSYNSYDRDSRERDMSFTEPPPWQRLEQKRNNDPYGYDDYYGGAEQLPGPYDSPPPDPYASPPYSSDDDAPDLYSRLSADFLDPSVSANEKDREMFKRRGMSDRKKAKKRAYFENMRDRERKREGRGGGRGGRSGKDDRQKCRFYQEGKCQKKTNQTPAAPAADRCIYSHNFIPAKKMEACKFFLQGYCAKSDMCIYLHSEVPCKFFHTGQKCFNNDSCKFSHDPLTESTKPLLEKAIILEETGSFKMPAVRPELLNKIQFGTSSSNNTGGGNRSPIKKITEKPHIEEEDEKTSPKRDTRDRNSVSPTKESNKPVASIFDIAVKPSAEMEEKLHKGLYNELASIKSGGSGDEMNNEPNHHPLTRPGGFYSETLSSPHKKINHSKSKSRWDEKSNPNLTPLGERKQGLLPTPPKNKTSPSSTPTAVTSGMTTQAAVNIILSAIRSHNTSSTPSSGATDPRVSAKVADPRLSAANDPRLAAQSDPRKDPRQDPRPADPRQSDPRQQPNRTESRPLDPRAAKLSDPRASDPRLHSSQVIKTPLLPDPRISNHTTELPARSELPVRPEPPRPAPTINGKPSKPMNWLLKPITHEVILTYLPPGYDVNQDETIVKDPRIKKRIQSLKSGAREPPPKLPDITAELQRIQNLQTKTNQTSENKARPVSYLPETSSFKPKSIVKSRLSSQADSADGDEDENSLQIDMQAEDNKSSVTT